jgi:nucleotide-binding universal stress UspA family protein
MSWATILAPLTGAQGDKAILAAAAGLASPFGAEVRAAHAPADAADLMPWMGEGFMGGVQVAALDSLKEAAQEGEKAARASFAAEACGRKSFRSLASPVWSSLCMEARLADVVVFGPDPAKGKGALVEAFQQILMEERRPVLVAKRVPDPKAPVAVAWDGGREASRAARSAIPWLQKAGEVTVMAAPQATPRDYDPGRLVEHLAERGVKAQLKVLEVTSDAGEAILEATRSLGAQMLVAGAFGHPRFQQFIFGGATRTLMQSDDGPSLFLSH